MAEVIVALDLPSGSDALRLLDRLPDARWVKVGSILMTREGPDLVAVLTERGLRVFLDLKWHDIPNTVAEAVHSARALGVAMATVHTLGGAGMMEAAAVAADGAIGIVGVTVLTSHDPASYGRALGRADVDLVEEALRQSDEAVRAGLSGVVCSPQEVT
jgi:orotidine-5'-phosphate decarboxylase